jgi:hypothetical protein
MPQFQSIRDVPQSGIQQWQMDMLNQVKENLEVLMGVRQAGVRSITTDLVTVVQAENITMKRSSAQPTGYNISGNLVADFNQFVQLIKDVNELANNVLTLQLQVNTLVRDLSQK